MSRHRFINDGRFPIPMGASASYACACGKRGSFNDIAHHITETADENDHEAVPVALYEGSPTAPYEQVATSDDFSGGNTMAHYLPNEPRRPARAEESEPLQRPVEPSIAELFQDMLRTAFQAGALSTTTGESFESWYQREVLQ